MRARKLNKLSKRVNNFDPTRPDYDWKADHFSRRGWLARWITFFSLFDPGYRHNRASQKATLASLSSKKPLPKKKP